MANAYLIKMATKPLYRRNYLPEITELSGEQRKVLGTEIAKDIIISGPAGSGKTILAIHRFIGFGNKKGELLTYTNILKNYISVHLKNKRIMIDARGIFEFVRAISGITVPPNASSQDFRDAANKVAIWSQQNGNQIDFIIADETQDFHSGHLGFISNYAERLNLFADDAQTLYDHGLSTTNIIGNMRLSHNRIIERLDIKGNYRNQPAVAQFAQPFYMHREMEPFPSAAPEGLSENPQVFLSANDINLRNEVIKQVERYVSSMDDATPKIGILTTDSIHQIQNVFNHHYDVINAENGIDENGNNIFREPDPIAMTMLSAKGLEFDYVILYNIDYRSLKNFRPNNYEQIIFTAITRARRSVSVFIKDDQDEFLEKVNNTKFDFYKI